MAKVPRHFDRLFEGADGVDEGVPLGLGKVYIIDDMWLYVICKIFLYI